MIEAGIRIEIGVVTRTSAHDLSSVGAALLQSLGPALTKARYQLPPGAKLILLNLLRTPGDVKLTALRKVYNPTPVQTSLLLDELRAQSFIKPTTLTVTNRSDAKKFFDRSQLDDSLPDELILRASAGSAILGASLQRQSLEALGSINAVTAAYVAKIKSPKAALDLNDAVALLATSLAAITGLSPPPDMHHRQYLRSKSLRAALHSIVQVEDIGVGLQRLVNLRVSRSNDVRWRRLTQKVFEPMATKPTPATNTDSQSAALVAVVAERAQASSTGWVLIFDAFQAYQTKHRMALNEFKDSLLSLAAASRLELGPLNVPLMIDDVARAQSAIVAGGYTYHLVRPSRQRARLRG